MRQWTIAIYHSNQKYKHKSETLLYVRVNTNRREGANNDSRGATGVRAPSASRDQRPSAGAPTLSAARPARGSEVNARCPSSRARLPRTLRYHLTARDPENTKTDSPQFYLWYHGSIVPLRLIPNRPQAPTRREQVPARSGTPFP